MDFSAQREQMVDNQIRPADVTNYELISAFLSTPREKFVPKDKLSSTYAEVEMPLPENRFMLTPRSFAKLLEAAKIRKTDNVLLVGSGLGYEAAVLSKLANSIIVLESSEELASAAEENLQSEEVDKAVVVNGPMQDGYKKAANYDVILFNGAVAQLPDALVAQIEETGHIGGFFADGALRNCMIGTKYGKSLTWETKFHAASHILPGFEAVEEFEF